MHWSRRAKRLGQAGVGRAGEDFAQQGERITHELEVLLPDRFYHHILDFGAGWGRFTKFFEPRGSHVWAVDIVPQWLVEASQKSQTLTPVKLEEPIIPVDSASIDLVADIMTTQSISDEQLLTQFLGELRRVLAPGGNIVTLHKLDGELRTPSVLATRLGLDIWSAVMSDEIDEAGDMYYYLIGKRGAR
jgi:ubiquinone/menaquinone biosynthesis C-methylase UbiE